MSYKWKILIIALLGMFPDMMNTTIATIALPNILSQFNESIDKMQLITSTYLLGMAVGSAIVTYIMGKFGIRKIWILTQIAYLVSSVLCGMAWNANSLIVFRVIQGLLGGVLVPVAMTMIFTTFAKEEQGKAMGLMGFPMVLAPTIGLTLGGYLVEYISWRWCFYISVPVILASIIATFVWLKDTEKQPELPLDFKGFFSASLGFSLVLFALTFASTWGWEDAKTIILLTIGLISIVVWAIIELREKFPLMDVRVFKHYGYSMGTVLTFVVNVAMYSAMLLLPLYLQNIRGLGAFESGLMMVPLALGAVVASFISGQFYNKIGPGLSVITGLLICGLATLQLSNLNENTSTGFIVLMLTIYGIGMGCSMMPIMTYTLAALPHHLTGAGSAINNVMKSVFASMATAIFATLLSNAQKTNMELLVQTVTPDSGTTLGILSTIQVYLQQTGLSVQAAYQEAIYLIYQKTALNAYLLAFNKVFIIGAIIMFAGIIPALFLLKNKKAKGKISRIIH